MQTSLLLLIPTANSELQFWVFFCGESHIEHLGKFLDSKWADPRRYETLHISMNQILLFGPV